MNVHHNAEAVPGTRLGRAFAIAVVAFTLAIGVAGCQSATQSVLSAPEVHRVTPVVPLGVDIDRPADRIEHDILAQQAELSQRFAGRPADRVEEELRREAQTSYDLVAGCGRYILIQASGSERVMCVEMTHG